MAVEKRETEYAKECDDVLALVVSVLRDAKAGKSLAEIAAGSLDELVSAVAGADQIPAEARANPAALSRTVHDRVWEAVAILTESDPPTAA